MEIIKKETNTETVYVRLPFPVKVDQKAESFAIPTDNGTHIFNSDDVVFGYNNDGLAVGMHIYSNVADALGLNGNVLDNCGSIKARWPECETVCIKLPFPVKFITDDCWYVVNTGNGIKHLKKEITTLRANEDGLIVSVEIPVWYAENLGLNDDIVDTCGGFAYGTRNSFTDCDPVVYVKIEPPCKQLVVAGHYVIPLGETESVWLLKCSTRLDICSHLVKGVFIPKSIAETKGLAYEMIPRPGISEQEESDE